MKNWFEKVLDASYTNPEFETSPRGLKIRETRNFSFDVDPYYPLYENEYRSTPLKYFAAEMIWYLSQDRSVNWIKDFSKMWSKLADENGLINSNYGNLILTKNEFGNSAWTWCYDSLAKDKDTRQAVMHYNNPTHRNPAVKDFPCTMYNIFSIRDNTLDLTFQMRSQDSIKGIAFDVPFGAALLQSMWLNLKNTVYPDLKLGLLHWNTNSIHSYESDWPLIDNMLAKPINLKPMILKFPIIDEKGNPNKVLLEQYNKPIHDIEASLSSWTNLSDEDFKL